MPAIRRLHDELIGKIAAGEVVERPASVAKELIENSVDAGADVVALELAAGGKASIVVRDNGCGMDADDCRLAFERHATSKIGSFEDLLEVRSLGFRGEALASIAAVARVVLETSTEDGTGTRCRAVPGEAIECQPISRSRGTSLEVDSLFFNVPARREFLKRDATELRRVVEVVHGYALARPEIRYRLRHDGRELFDLLGTSGEAEPGRRRIAQIFGDEVARALQPIESRTAGGRIHGFVGDRSTVRGRRSFVFVNGRLIRDRAVMAAFYRAVRQVWHAEQFPALFLFLDLPPAEVDVNVHPQKSEVRFRDGRVPHEIFKAVSAALDAGLGEGGAPRARAPETLPWSGLAWRGFGERAGRAGEVREPRSESPAKLAEAVYSPLAREPVALTGKRGEERSLRLLGQYKGTIILLEGPDGLYLIDQHVAHERILYERLRTELRQRAPRSQTLLEPVLLELSAAETLRLTEWSEQLAECGFELSSMSGDTIAVTAVPAVLKGSEAEELLEELARGGQASESRDDLRGEVLDALAASMACRSAVKMHEPLSADKMEAVVAELFAAEQPFSCPHGRPTILKMDDADLERRFGRR